MTGNGHTGPRHILTCLQQAAWWYLLPHRNTPRRRDGFNPDVDTQRLTSIRARAARGVQTFPVHDVRFLLTKITEESWTTSD